MPGSPAYFAYFGPDLWQSYKISDQIATLFDYIRGGSYKRNALKQSASATVTFDDVIGCKDAKEAMKPLIKYLQNIEQWDAAELTPPMAYLLTGETRAGKTFFANALRGETNKLFEGKIKFKFLEISHDEIHRYGIKEVLRVAKEHWAPCILFIDELHLLHVQDTGDPKVFNDFLTALSGLDARDPKKPVILIAATNNPENVGKALRQQGRFGMEVRFEYPTIAEREVYLRKRLEHYAVDPEGFGIDLNKLARETNNCTYEMLADVVAMAYMDKNMNGGQISQEKLENAIDRKVYRIMNGNVQDISQKEQQLISAYFAGEAFIAREVKSAKKIARMTINQVTVKVQEEGFGWSLWRPKQAGIQRGQVFTYHDKDNSGIVTQEDMINDCKVALAGHIAERLLTGTVSAYRPGSRQLVYDTIQKIIAGDLSIKLLPKQEQDLIAQQVLTKLKEYEQEVEQAMIAHKDIISELSNVLYEKHTLSGDEITAILEGTKSVDQAVL